MKRTLLVVACLLSLNAEAACNQVEADKGIQPEMNACASDAYHTADKQLNILYKKRMVQLEKQQRDFPDDASGKESIKKLKIAQIAWLKYRDADCEYEAYQYEGGSIQPLIHSTCLESKTDQRIKDIKEMLVEH